MAGLREASVGVEGNFLRVEENILDNMLLA
jgi:hypothetical protein